MLDDLAVLHIVKVLSRLRQLNLSNCVNRTIKSIFYIAKYCQRLQELIICGVDCFSQQLRPTIEYSEVEIGSYVV